MRVAVLFVGLLEQHVEYAARASKRGDQLFAGDRGSHADRPFCWIFVSRRVRNAAWPSPAFARSNGA